MPSEENPYLSPSEVEISDPFVPKPDNWTNLRLVTLFFAPSFLLVIFAVTPWILTMFQVKGISSTLNSLAGPSIALSMIAVSILSASIHMKRQGNAAGTLILFSLVYLIAEIFAIILTLVALFFTPFFSFGPGF